DRFKNSGRFLRRACLGKFALPPDNILLLLASPFRWHPNCQSFPTLSPSSFQYLASTGGFHPDEKAVGPFAPYVARLIGSFHRSSTPLDRIDGQETISIIHFGYCQFISAVRA